MFGFVIEFVRHTQIDKNTELVDGLEVNSSGAPLHSLAPCGTMACGVATPTRNQETMKKITSLLFVLFLSVQYIEASQLWLIGRPDSSYNEFYAAGDRQAVVDRFDDYVPVDLRPGSGFNATADFPWILPGPVDTWAGSKSREIRISFDVSNLPANVSTYVLEIRAAAQSRVPPLLEADLNGTKVTLQTIGGATGDRILTNPRGVLWRPYRLVFDADVLRQQGNTLTIKSTRGSWLVFDSVRFFPL